MKKWGEFLEKRWVSNLLTVCAGVLLYMALKNFGVISSFFSSVYRIVAPIIVGMIMAYLIDPIAIFYEQKFFSKIKNQKSRRIASVILAICCVLILIILFFVALIPSLVSCITSIYSNRDIYMNKTDELFQNINAWNMGFHLDLSTLFTFLEDVSGTIFEYIADNMGQVINVSKNVGSAFVNVLLGFILCIYFLSGKQHLMYGINELRSSAMTEETLKRHDDFWIRCHKIFIQYIGYDLLDGLIIGAINAVIMLILGMPYAALISVIVGVTNLLPTFGPVIGLILGGLLLILNNPIYALWFLIMVIIIQTVDGYILKPRLFGGALGIPPVWTLIAIVIGGKLFGAIGILLAIPFAAVLTFLYKENFLPWLQRRKTEK